MEFFNTARRMLESKLHTNVYTHTHTLVGVHI